MPLAEDLMVADFEQCFEQMRHYDQSYRHSFEFGFAGMLAVIAASGTLIQQYGFTPIVLTTVGILLLASSVVGFLFFVVSLARNRVYFAFVARYVNEFRALYLKEAPGGVGNRAGMYTDPRYPRIFGPGSSHSVQVWLLCLCNAALLAVAVNALLAAPAATPSISWWAGLIVFLISLPGQVVWVLIYWSRKERQRTADSAVFGKEREHGLV